MFLSVSQLSPFLEATSDGGKGIFGSSASQGRRLPSLSRSKTRVREAETCVEIFQGEIRDGFGPEICGFGLSAGWRDAGSGRCGPVSAGCGLRLSCGLNV